MFGIDKLLEGIKPVKFSPEQAIALQSVKEKFQERGPQDMSEDEKRAGFVKHMQAQGEFQESHDQELLTSVSELMQTLGIDASAAPGLSRKETGILEAQLKLQVTLLAHQMGERIQTANDPSLQENPIKAILTGHAGPKFYKTLRETPDIKLSAIYDGLEESARITYTKLSPFGKPLETRRLVLDGTHGYCRLIIRHSDGTRERHTIGPFSRRINSDTQSRLQDTVGTIGKVLPTPTKSLR